jgi:hypothetical protein
MSQAVGSLAVADDTSLSIPLLDHPPDGTCAEAPTSGAIAQTHEEWIGLAVVCNAHPLSKPGSDGRLLVLRYHDEIVSLLSALAPHLHYQSLVLRPQVADIGSVDLDRAETTEGHQDQDGAVPKSDQAVVTRRQDGQHFTVAQSITLVAP